MTRWPDPDRLWKALPARLEREALDDDGPGFAARKRMTGRLRIARHRWQRIFHSGALTPTRWIRHAGVSRTVQWTRYCCSWITGCEVVRFCQNPASLPRSLEQKC